MRVSLIELLVAAMEQKYAHEPKSLVRELIQKALHGRISKQIALQLASALFWQSEYESDIIKTQINEYRLEDGDGELG